MEKRGTFVFHAEWAEIVRDYAEDVRLEVYEAAVRYAVSGDTVELRPLAKMAFGFIRRDIDRDQARYDEYVERQRANGSKGGRPRKGQASPGAPAGQDEKAKPFLGFSEKPKKPAGFSENPAKPKKANNDYDYVDDNVLNPPPPRAREAEAGDGGREDGFYAEAAGNEMMRQQTCMNLHIGRGEYDSLLAEFRGEALAKGIRHVSAEDYRRHAYDWMRKHVGIAREREQRESGKGKENEGFNDNSKRAIGAGAAAFEEFLRG